MTPPERKPPESLPALPDKSDLFGDDGPRRPTDDDTYSRKSDLSGKDLQEPTNNDTRAHKSDLSDEGPRRPVDTEARARKSDLSGESSRRLADDDTYSCKSDLSGKDLREPTNNDARAHKSDLSDEGPRRPADTEARARKPDLSGKAASSPARSGADSDKSYLSGMTVLILGGTTEGRTLAEALSGTARHFSVINSLAGRTSSPILPPGEMRIGGFGGVGGLVAFLRERRIDVLVDATHPFAEGISANAATAAALAGVPLLAVRRPGWTEQPGDDWRRVPSTADAAALLPRIGRRVFLTTGRQAIAAFAAVDECWFLARSVEPPLPPTPQRIEVVLDRGPFTVDGELRLLREHRIDVLVSKDSGGADAKLVAARTAGIPVILIDRPPAPPATAVVASAAEATAWLTVGRGSGHLSG